MRYIVYTGYNRMYLKLSLLIIRLTDRFNYYTFVTCELRAYPFMSSSAKVLQIAPSINLPQSLHYVHEKNLILTRAIMIND